jgi:hypothetical protein
VTHIDISDVGSERVLSSCATGGSETEKAIYDSYWTAGVNGWRVGAGLSRPMEELLHSAVAAQYRDRGLPGPVPPTMVHGHQSVPRTHRGTV